MSTLRTRRGPRDPGGTAGQPKKIGRPTRKAASQKALQSLLEGGVDPATIDPVLILRSIAGDASAASSARVASCKILIDLDKAGQLSASKSNELENEASRSLSKASQRAVVLLDEHRRRTEK